MDCWIDKNKMTTTIDTIEGLMKHLGDPMFKEKIKDYELLMEALGELDRMIEMQEAKMMVLSIIQYYLVVGELSEMNNIDIRGSPGVGKTQLGCILAKIYNSLGILKRTDKPSSTLGCLSEATLDTISKANKKITGLNRQIKDCQSLIKKSLDVYDLIHRDLSKNTRWYGKYGYHMDQLEEILINLENTVHTQKEDKEVKKYSFTVASRESFVAGYLGQTALKTLDLLESCRGGVLFIDEAYSLFHGERDSYGMECLTTLNKFLSEHPKEIIIIFGGYKDLLEETIYKAQPGLKRRVMWTFEINGYTPEGLSRIFKYQLAKEKWTLDPSISIVEFFEKHKECFKNYGGDTEKLALQCKINYGKTTFKEWVSQDKIFKKTSTGKSVNKLYTGDESLKVNVYEEDETGLLIREVLTRPSHDKMIRKEHLDISIEHLKKKEEKDEVIPMMYM